MGTSVRVLIIALSELKRAECVINGILSGRLDRMVFRGYGGMVAFTTEDMGVIVLDDEYACSYGDDKLMVDGEFDVVDELIS